MLNALLIAGSSHAGKTTCAHAIADRLGWRVLSTDTMGRHPGRPWKGAPPAVIEFYLSLSDGAIDWFMRVHHANLRPVIAARLAEARQMGGVVLEGAALRPEVVADWRGDGLDAVCFHAPDHVLRQRIEQSARAADPDPETWRATERFIGRSLRENAAFRAAAEASSMALVDTGSEGAVDAFVEDVVRRVRGRSGGGTGA